MGGIRADVHGRTNIKGFFACGECACNGIHGANRLASNSLLEGLVFGRLIGMQADEILGCTGKTFAFRDIVNHTDSKPSELYTRAEIANIQREMSENVGITRDRKGLEKALDKLNDCGEKIRNIKNETLADFELQNVQLLSKLVIESALEREESRGAHYRLDFNKTDDEKWQKHIIKTIDGD
jgi:L-aspartate oxidase